MYLFAQQKKFIFFNSLDPLMKLEHFLNLNHFFPTMIVHILGAFWKIKKYWIYDHFLDTLKKWHPIVY
jgi:hypothetical protein